MEEYQTTEIIIIVVIKKCILVTENQYLFKGLWCIMPLSTIFQLYCGSQFDWFRKSEYTKKTTELPQAP
jgi:hypothetical protein